MTKYARITGWGKYVPERVLTNFDLEKMVDTSDEWIRTRTGIRERHIAAPGETCSTMSLAAAKQALDQASLHPSDLDLIIVATSSPDYFVPSVASMVQDQLGATHAAAFGLVAGCTGWVYGLVTASQFIQTGAYRNALVLGTEHLTIGVDWTDRTTCVLFGDGSGAVVLEASEQPTGLMAFELGSDGADYDALILPGCGGAHPASHEV
ncbi:MAG: beta-ketoacyl-ACP synthase 3, partial [Anaerolineae bacterium]